MTEQARREERLRALRQELDQLEQVDESWTDETEEAAPESLPPSAAPPAPLPGAQQSGRAPARPGWSTLLALVLGALLLGLVFLVYLFPAGPVPNAICARVVEQCVPAAGALPLIETSQPTAVAQAVSPATPTLLAVATFTATPTATPVPTFTPTATATPTPTVTATVTATATETAPVVPSPTPQQFRASVLSDFTVVYEEAIGAGMAVVSTLRQGTEVYVCAATTNSLRVRYLISLKPCYLDEAIGYMNATTLSEIRPAWPANQITPFPPATP